jgi:hypothetical protein
MKYIHINLWLILLGFLVAIGCQKEYSIESIEDNEILNDKNKKNAALDKLAFLTAAALTNSEFRIQIKEEALKQFDGDFDILYSKLEANGLKNSYSNSNFYLDKLVTNHKSTGSFTKEELVTLIKTIPKFQISVPVKCQEWETESQIPFVTYVPSNFDEKTFTHVKAYDKDGNIHMLSLDKEPNFPVIVLGSNERTDEEGELIFNETNLKSGDNYDLPPDLDPGSGSGGSGGSGGGTSATSRTDGLAEYIYKIKFTDIQAVEAWLLGKPEIRLRVFSRSGIQIHSAYFVPNRSSVENSWHTLNHKICNWYWSSYGEGLLVSWYEEDGGASIPISISYYGITLSTTISNGDDEIGYSEILKQHSKYYLYNVGVMRCFSPLNSQTKI